MNDQGLWIIRIRGPQRLLLHFEGNPPIEHLGGDSAHTQVLTSSEVEQILSAAGDLEISAEPMSGQSSSQKEERSRLMAQSDRAWPTVKCLSCSWLDPLQENPCGARSWPLESVVTLLETSQVHILDSMDCPLKDMP